MHARIFGDNDDFAHSQGNPYGQNLYMMGSADENPSDLCQKAVRSWYGQRFMYNGQGFNEDTGYFTQLLWKSSSNLGCASSQASESGNRYVVCNFAPSGNINGRYEMNVPF